MAKYEIKFDLDFEEDLNYDPDDQYIDNISIDDDCILDAFSTDEKVKEFEDWYNEGFDNEEDYIKFEYLDCDSDDEGQYCINLTTNKPLEDEKSFAKEMIDYIFDANDYPYVSYHVSGVAYEVYWDGYRQSPEERKVNVDFDDSEYVRHYTNLEINKLQ